MDVRRKFERICKLTCTGGSEMGWCSCESPASCEMRHHPLFPEYRDMAKERMLRGSRLAADTSEDPK